jgi:hypothetical protein
MQSSSAGQWPTVAVIGLFVAIGELVVCKVNSQATQPHKHQSLTPSPPCDPPFIDVE